MMKDMHFRSQLNSHPHELGAGGIEEGPDRPDG